jgi:hypothetical protein
MISCAAFSRELVQSMSAEDLAQHLKDCLLRAFDQRYQILSGSPLRPNNVSRDGSGTGLTLPHLHRDWAHPSCSCTGSELLYFSRGTKPVAKHGLVRALVVPSISHTQPPPAPSQTVRRTNAPCRAQCDAAGRCAFGAAPADRAGVERPPNIHYWRISSVPKACAAMACGRTRRCKDVTERLACMRSPNDPRPENHAHQVSVAVVDSSTAVNGAAWDGVA